MDRPAKKNLTLAIDEKLLRDARKYALDHQTSVNEIVRSHLASLVEDKDGRKAAAKRLEEFFNKPRKRLKHWKWNREELYDRS